MTAFEPLRGALLRGSASALTLRLAGAGLAFGLQVLLARLLGHAQYGVYILAFSSITTLSVVLKLGLDVTTLRYVPEYRDGERWELLRGLLRASARLVWLVTGGVAVAMAVVAGLFRPGDDPALAWTFCVAAAALPPMTAQYLAEARLRAFDRIAAARIPSELALPVLVGLLAASLASATGRIDAPTAMICTAIACGLTYLLSAAVFRRVAPSRSLAGPVQRDVRAWRTTAVQLAFYSTTMLVIGQVDIVITGILLGPEAAGGYATASRISKFVPFGITAVNLTLMPLVSRLFHSGQIRELQRTITWAAGAILVVTVPLGAAVIAFSTPLLHLFGPEFVAAQGALVVLTVGRMANALCGPTATLLTMSGNQRDAAFVALGSAIVDGLLLLLLVPRFGMLGAALATTSTTVFWNLAQLPLVRRRTGIHPTFFTVLLPSRRSAPDQRSAGRG